VTIKNASINGFKYGVYLNSTSNDVVCGNNITANNYCGICLSYSSHNSLSENNIANNNYGVYLQNSSYNIIQENFITANNGDGIYLDKSLNNIISGNFITNDNYGINLQIFSNSNTISGNNIAINRESGVNLGSSFNNTISRNNITANNKNGIMLGGLLTGCSNNIISGNNVTSHKGYGTYLGVGMTLYNSSNNKIFHNNFINNTKQVYSYDSINIWDDGYPSGGNFWSDYTGVDEKGGPNQDQPGSDGIGDTPYLIDEDNQDRYPLMSRWAPPEHELVVSITAPASVTLGASLSHNITVSNQGLSNETYVYYRIIVSCISGAHENRTTQCNIPFLQAGDTHTWTYEWTPYFEGIYNVTAYVLPVPGETSIENNQMTKFVTVGVPTVTVPTPVEVGVKAGDWIKCTYAISGWPSGTPYPEWLKVEFLSVQGTNATVRVTMHMSDGTEQNATVPVDVVAGGGAFQGLTGFVIPANCTTGDSIYMSGYGNVTIAGETTSSYAGATRTVVYASFSQYGTQLTYYWDKLTGAMVEASVVSGGVTATGKATETNMWQAAPSGFPIEPIYLYILAALAIIIAVGAVAFIVRRKKKPPEEVKSPQT
jgi:parallel beta-helix repeat protein